MKINKILIIMLLLFMCCLCVGSTFAADVSVADICNTNDVSVSDISNINHDVNNFDDLKLSDNSKDKVNQLRAGEGNFTELREIIQNANDSSVYLNKDYSYVEGEDKWTSIQITKSLTINGNGHTINAFGFSTFIFSTRSDVRVDFYNITFVNSSNSAIYFLNNGAVDYCNFINCHSNDDGGAIHFYGDYGYISNSIFNNCSAKNGGAIYWQNGHTDTNACHHCTFDNCHASDNGGAIYCKQYKKLMWAVLFADFNFTNCSAKNGSAIYFLDNGSVENCNFINCHSNDDGGAIHFYGDYGHISNSIFNNCSAKNGGAIYWQKGYTDTMGCKNCTFDNCHASENGGAIYFKEESSFLGTVMLTDFNFTNCSAKNGGAIYSQRFTYLFASASFDSCSASDKGSVIYISNQGVLDLPKDIKYTPIVADEKAAIYNDGYISSSQTMIIVLDNSTYSYVGGSTLLNATITTNGMNVAGGNLTFLINGEKCLATATDSGLYTFEYTGALSESQVVSATYTGANVFEVKTGRIILKNVEIILPENPEFIVGAGDNYTIIIKSEGEAIGADYAVVLELVNGGNPKNYTLTTDDEGSVSLPIYLGYAKVYGFNIYFDAQDGYAKGFASQNILVKAIVTKLVTDYVGDVFNSSVFSYDDWTATLLDVNDNPISNVIVNVNFTGLNNKTVVYKIKSDSNGDVKLSLRLGFVGLYKISANFEGNNRYASSSSNNISVNISKTNVTIIAKNITTTNKSGENYTIQLLTTNDKAISGAKVYINFLNKDGVGTVYKLKTDAEGKAFLPLNLAYVGKYDLIIFFNDTENYIEKVTKTTHVKVVKDEQVLATVKE